MFLTSCGSSSQAYVKTADGTIVVNVSVSVARTAAERSMGLRGRSLAPGEGFVLRFPIEGEVCIVNTGVDDALDVVFADSDGQVLDVVRSIPADDRTPRCVDRVRTVLEILKGEAAEVAPGDVLYVDG